MKCLTFTLLMPFIAIFGNFVITQLVARQYPVHTEGGVIVTGASTGIGRHAAEELAKLGFVVYAGVRKEKDFESIKATNIPSLVPVFLDVTSEDSIDACIDTVKKDLAERTLELVGLVNNAGIALDHDAVETQDINAWKRLYEVNIFGPVRMAQKALPQLRASKGRIVQISSMAGIVSSPLGGPYASSKFALEAISDALRIEMLPHQVSVSSINPAYVKSQISTTAIAASTPKAPHFQELYGMFEDVERSRSLIEQADSPTVTTDVIVHALTSRYPKVNYVVANVDGTPAWIFARLIGSFPKRAIDLLVANVMDIDLNALSSSSD